MLYNIRPRGTTTYTVYIWKTFFQQPLPSMIFFDIWLFEGSISIHKTVDWKPFGAKGILNFVFNRLIFVSTRYVTLTSFQVLLFGIVWRMFTSWCLSETWHWTSDLSVASMSFAGKKPAESIWLPPLFLPTQPQVMRYVWKKVRQDKLKVGGWLRVCGGHRDPSNFKGFRLDKKHTFQIGGRGGTAQI